MRTDAFYVYEKAWYFAIVLKGIIGFLNLNTIAVEWEMVQVNAYECLNNPNNINYERAINDMYYKYNLLRISLVVEILLIVFFIASGTKKAIAEYHNNGNEEENDTSA